MKRSFGVIFGGFIAYVLLGLYTITLSYIIWETLKCNPEACEPRIFNEGTIYVITTIGGLVSALVISKLTVSDPEGSVAVVSERKINWKTLLELAYLLVWLFTGLSALVVGVMIRPDVNTTLSDIGTTWLGLAVASGFAYFGVQPK